jgi:hypothetical protein
LGQSLRHGIWWGIVLLMPVAVGDAAGSRAPARLFRRVVEVRVRVTARGQGKGLGQRG